MLCTIVLNLSNIGESAALILQLNHFEYICLYTPDLETFTHIASTDSACTAVMWLYFCPINGCTQIQRKTKKTPVSFCHCRALIPN